MSVATITALMFGSLIILLMTGLPIAFCLGALAVVFTALVAAPMMYETLVANFDQDSIVVPDIVQQLVGISSET